MTKILDAIRAGRGKLEDLDLLLEVADSMGIIPGTTICGLSDGAAWPVKNAIMKFRGEFEEYITQRPTIDHAGPRIDGGALTISRRFIAEHAESSERIEDIDDSLLCASVARVKLIYANRITLTTSRSSSAPTSG